MAEMNMKSLFAGAALFALNAPAMAQSNDVSFVQTITEQQYFKDYPGKAVINGEEKYAAQFQVSVNGGENKFSLTCKHIRSVSDITSLEKTIINIGIPDWYVADLHPKIHNSAIEAILACKPGN